MVCMSRMSDALMGMVMGRDHGRGRHNMRIRRIIMCMQW